jgi:hypothetical protein
MPRRRTQTKNLCLDRSAPPRGSGGRPAVCPTAAAAGPPAPPRPRPPQRHQGQARTPQSSRPAPGRSRKGCTGPAWMGGAGGAWQPAGLVWTAAGTSLAGPRPSHKAPHRWVSLWAACRPTPPFNLAPSQALAWACTMVGSATSFLAWPLPYIPASSSNVAGQTARGLGCAHGCGCARSAARAAAACKLAAGEARTTSPHARRPLTHDVPSCTTSPHARRPLTHAHAHAHELKHAPAARARPLHQRRQRAALARTYRAAQEQPEVRRCVLAAVSELRREAPLAWRLRCARGGRHHHLAAVGPPRRAPRSLPPHSTSPASPLPGYALAEREVGGAPGQRPPHARRDLAVHEQRGRAAGGVGARRPLGRSSCGRRPCCARPLPHRLQLLAQPQAVA